MYIYKLKIKQNKIILSVLFIKLQKKINVYLNNININLKIKKISKFYKQFTTTVANSSFLF